MKTLLIIAHAPSLNTQAISQALEKGARAAADNLEVILAPPLETSIEQMKSADGVIFFTPENFGYMSGALKDLFDRSYYALIDSKRGTPYALIVRAGKDGAGCKRSVESILVGLGWKQVQETLILHGEYKAEFLDQVAELGSAFAAGLSLGVI